MTLSHANLETLRHNERVIEFATLGSGNHFIELQGDDDGRLWLMVHSGSRGIGPAIRDHDLRHASPSVAGCAPWRPRVTKDTNTCAMSHGRDASRTPAGARWLRKLARSCRTRWVRNPAGTRSSALITITCRWSISESMNSWCTERARCRRALGKKACYQGAMGSSSFHVEGRGHEAALCSSAHGAGRALSRTAARSKVTERDLRRQMAGVWFDFRLSERLCDEARPRTRTSRRCFERSEISSR
jgi:tRNA-splicing ligase RtcB